MFVATAIYLVAGSALLGILLLSGILLLPLVMSLLLTMLLLPRLMLLLPVVMLLPPFGDTVATPGHDSFLPGARPFCQGWD